MILIWRGPVKGELLNALRVRNFHVLHLTKPWQNVLRQQRVQKHGVNVSQLAFHWLNELEKQSDYCYIRERLSHALGVHQRVVVLGLEHCSDYQVNMLLQPLRRQLPKCVMMRYQETRTVSDLYREIDRFLLLGCTKDPKRKRSSIKTQTRFRVHTRPVLFNSNLPKYTF